MDEVLKLHKSEMEEMMKLYCDTDESDAFAVIAKELFSEKTTVARITFYLAFALIFMNKHPHRKHEVCEKVFKSLCENITI